VVEVDPAAGELGAAEVDPAAGESGVREVSAIEDHASEVEVLTLPGNCGAVAQMGRDRADESMADLTVGLQIPLRR